VKYIKVKNTIPGRWFTGWLNESLGICRYRRVVGRQLYSELLYELGSFICEIQGKIAQSKEKKKTKNEKKFLKIEK